MISRHRLSPTGVWVCLGSLYVLLFSAIAGLSPYYEYGVEPGSRPTLTLVALFISCGLLYLFLVGFVIGNGSDTRPVIWILVVGVAARVLLAPSTPILEDDYYRYLFDGGLTAHGVNPYKYSPEEIVGENSVDKPIPAKARDLAEESGEVAYAVNHPHLRTIYPPVAQAVFALAHWIAPWKIQGLRLIFLGFDVLSLLLVILLLRQLRLPVTWILIYWWNPILIKEVYNSAHVDVIIIPFVLASLCLAARKRPVWSAALLALAAGVKLWPVILLPLVLRPAWEKPGRLCLSALVFVLLLGLLFYPIYLGGLDGRSGFTAYSRSWEMNDPLFMTLKGGLEQILRVVPLGQETAPLLTRLLMLSLLGAWVLWLAMKPWTGLAELLQKSLWVVGALFLLSPTQFPWYYLWLLPLLVFRPSPSLLLLTLLLPLYYLRFYFRARETVHLFDYGIVWLEFVPIWLVLGWEILTKKGIARSIAQGVIPPE